MKSACQEILSIMLMLYMLPAFALAQPTGKVEYYSTEQGLSHQRITAMLKDREGFMWFGTWDGINRFDGQSFVAYKSSPGDPYLLSNSRIDRIMEDQSDHLWIQTADHQIYRFDKKNEKFQPVSALAPFHANPKLSFTNILLASGGWVWLQSQNEGLFCISQTALPKGQLFRYCKDATVEYRLPSNMINFLHEDNEHRIWIGTSAGLCCLERSPSGIYINCKTIPVAHVGSTSLTKCTEDADFIYFGAEDGRFIVFNKKAKAFGIYKITTGRINALLRSGNKSVVYAATSLGEVIAFEINDQQFTTAVYHSAENLFTLFEDQSGILWVQPEKFGVIRFDPVNRSFRLFTLHTGKIVNDFDSRFFRVVEDHNGIVWVCMKGGGFGYYDRLKNTMKYVLFTPETTNYQLPEVVNNLYYDRAGIFWLTVNQRQLVKIVLQDNDFKKQVLATNSATQSENEIRGICYDNKGRLWLGAKRTRLFVYQNDVQLNGLFINEPAGGVTGVYTILQDKRANIWLGTKGNGLFKATPVNSDETKYRLTHFLPNKNKADSLPGNSIYALLEDRLGRVWIGSMDGGLALIEDSSATTRFIHNGPAFINYPKDAFQNIRHMALDKDGNIWMGTTNGLLLLDVSGQPAHAYKFKSYSTFPGNKESLGNNDIQFIYSDRKNRMWLATSGGGLCEAVGGNPFQALRFRNYTTKDGLPNDYILSCVEDGQGNLWLATENGLSKFNPETGAFRNYDSYDGLPKTAFSEAAVTKQGTGGLLYFGTATGYLSFDPEQINTIKKQANIAFTNLQINNENVGPGSDDTFLKIGVNYISQLTLKHDQNIITISYAILDYGVGGRQPFACRLQGFDTTWHDDRGFGRATYTNLSPGQYIFEVKSLSADLYSNTPYKRLTFTILPPLWKTWWAYTVYVLFIGMLLYFIRRYALVLIRLRNKIAIEQKVAALKMNFFTNISHELRTPLTLIVNPLEQLSKKEKLSEEGTTYVDVARRNAARMVRFINQLLDLRKIQSEKATLHITRVEVITFVKTIIDHFTEAASSKNIHLEMAADPEALIAFVDAEKLDVVIYNLLGNAIKFTPEGRSIIVQIRSVPGEQNFIIAVQDQGPGVPKEKLEEIFELFQEGSHSKSREAKGTGIGLALSRELVNLHGGTIRAENNSDGGLNVIVKLGLGTEPDTQGNFLTDRRGPVEDQLPTPILNAHVQQKEQAPLVLLVEDNDELRFFIKSQLSECYRVETAKDGEEGLQKALELVPDLIVSDIMMPRQDGIQLLNKVKNNVNTSHIPVVLLSAKYSIESQIEGLKYGADYYITKPFNSTFLIASIDNLVNQRKKLFESLVEKKRLITLSTEPVVITSKDELFLKEVIKIVEEKIGDVDFKIETVAESMAMSHKTFYRKFRSLTGLTPVEFVRDIRLQKAKQLFDAGESNISEVAYAVGFSLPSYFSTCFKEKFHVSPSDYTRALTK